MKVTQVQDLVNSAIQQTSGQSILLKEDLSNVVDVGSEIFGESLKARTTPVTIGTQNFVL